MKKSFALILIFQLLLAFPPRDEKTFINNNLRLLNSKQYAVLVEYFHEYYPNFNQPKNIDYIKKIILRIPFIDRKEVILKTYINNTKDVKPFVYDLYGQIKLFQKNYEEVIKSYSLYDKVEKYYYLGLGEKELGNLVDAEKWFVKAIKKIEDKNLINESYLQLAEIYLKWKDTRKSIKALKKVSKNFPKKYIIQYYIYGEKENKKLQKITLRKIKRLKNNPIIDEFLEKENLK